MIAKKNTHVSYCIEHIYYANVILRSKKTKTNRMFRKLVSNLAFSPALVGQLGFYARRLKREETTRRLGLIFTALALVVQSLTVFTPPQSANASNASDFISGGVQSKADILAAYDRSANGNGDFKQIMDYAGITRAELKNMTDESLNSKGKGTGENAWQTWGRSHVFSSAQGEVKHVVPLGGDRTSTVYSKPLWLYDSTSYTIANGSTYDAFRGHSAKIGDFAIMKDCGNLITSKTPRPHPQGSFLAANCNIIRGLAFDGRNRDAKVKVFLYFGGPPGRGDKSEGIMTNSENRFEYSVPLKYQKATKPTKVWGVMVPLAGWNESTVQFENTAEIPGGCIKPEPGAACSTLTVSFISRTVRSLSATASVDNGAKITGYTFTVKDAQGKVVFEKLVPSTATTIKSGEFDLKLAGKYTSSVVVHTSIGDKSGTQCAKPIEVATEKMCAINPQLPLNHPDCKPCPGNPELWIKDAECVANVTQSKTARNLTQNTPDATATTAQASDRIEYTIYVENIGLIPADVVLNEELADVLEYSTLQQNGGGSFDTTQKVLGWGTVTLKPGEKVTRAFVVQVASAIPATPQGTSEPSSYDCIMTNGFGNTVSIKVACEAPKVLEATVEQLPSTGPTENILFGGIVASVVTFFWARSRQINKEVRLIRKDFNMGTI